MGLEIEYAFSVTESITQTGIWANDAEEGVAGKSLSSFPDKPRQSAGRATGGPQKPTQPGVAVPQKAKSNSMAEAKSARLKGEAASTKATANSRRRTPRYYV